ncbi:MAG: hypothetical protein EOM80_10175 [Erysipelotrichia bacterium]|nr:hypothetical protein [Erysipelotrichia bacterium]
MAINQINSYLQQVLLQNLSSTSVQPEQLKDSTQLLTSAMQAKSSTATISASGAKLNNISNIIRETGDAQAYEGFQTSMTQARESSDPLKMVRLLNSASYAAEQNPGLLSESFSFLAAANVEGDSSLIDGFNSVFSSTVEKTGLQGLSAFNQAMGAVQNADYSDSQVTLGENMKQMLATFSEVGSSGNSTEENISNLKKLAQGIELKDSADSIWNYFNEFTGADPV